MRNVDISFKFVVGTKKIINFQKTLDFCPYVCGIILLFKKIIFVLGRRITYGND